MSNVWDGLLTCGQLKQDMLPGADTGIRSDLAVRLRPCLPSERRVVDQVDAELSYELQCGPMPGVHHRLPCGSRPNKPAQNP